MFQRTSLKVLTIHSVVGGNQPLLKGGSGQSTNESPTESIYIIYNKDCGTWWYLHFHKINIYWDLCMCQALCQYFRMQRKWMESLNLGFCQSSYLSLAFHSSTLLTPPLCCWLNPSRPHDHHVSNLIFPAMPTVYSPVQHCYFNFLAPLYTADEILTLLNSAFRSLTGVVRHDFRKTHTHIQLPLLYWLLSPWIQGHGPQVSPQCFLEILLYCISLMSSFCYCYGWLIPVVCW